MKHLMKHLLCIHALLAFSAWSAHASLEVLSMFRTHSNYGSRVFTGLNAPLNCREASRTVQQRFESPAVVAADLTLIEASCVSVNGPGVQLVITHEHPFAESLSAFRLRYSSSSLCRSAIPTLESRLESASMPVVYGYCEGATAILVVADPVSKYLASVNSYSKHDTYGACMASAAITVEGLRSVGAHAIWVDCTARDDEELGLGYYSTISSAMPAGLISEHLTGNLYTAYETCMQSVRDLEDALWRFQLIPTSSFCYKEGMRYREKVSYFTSVHHRIQLSIGGSNITAADCRRSMDAMKSSLERRGRRVIHSYCEAGSGFRYRIHHLPR